MLSPQMNRSSSMKDSNIEDEVHSMQFKIILLGDGAVGKVLHRNEHVYTCTYMYGQISIYDYVYTFI